VPNPQPTPELLDGTQSAALAGVSLRTWLAFVAKREAPAPVVLPARRLTRWRRSDVVKWILELPTKD
jgi:predicted DNA-binding transcriptional regulator AlpA